MQSTVQEPKQDFDTIAERLHQTGEELKTIKDRIDEFQKRLDDFKHIIDSRKDPHG